MTLLELAKSVWITLGVAENAKNYDKTLILYPKINEVLSNIYKGTYHDILTGKIIKGGKMSFTRRHIRQGLITTGTLNGNITTGSTTILCDTTGKPVFGAIYIGGQIVEYTGITPTSLTGVTGVQGGHKQGLIFDFLYQLPANSHKIASIEVVGIQGNTKHLEDYRLSTDNISFNDDDIYAVIEWNNKKYILIRSKLNKHCIITYHTNHVRLTADGNVLPLADDDMEMLECIVSGELANKREEGQQATSLLTLGYSKLHMFFIDQSSETRQLNKHVEVRKSSLRYY